MNNILLVAEDFSVKPSEGLQVFAYHLAKYLTDRTNLVVASSAPKQCTSSFKSFSINDKWIISKDSISFFRCKKFDSIIYVPSSSFTAGSLFRSIIIMLIFGSCPIIIAHQPRNAGFLHRYFSLFSKPQLVLSPSFAIRSQCSALSIHSSFITPGYDWNTFTPPNGDLQYQLRTKYNLPLDKYIVLHVGHIAKSRNLDVLINFEKWDNDIQVVVVAGYSDSNLKDSLLASNVIILDSYIENIQEVYKASDCYIFPVVNASGCLDIPLSILEASGCNLPIVSTRFGYFGSSLASGKGLFFYDNPDEIPALIQRAKSEAVETRDLFSSYTWDNVFDSYLLPYLPLE